MKFSVAGSWNFFWISAKAISSPLTTMFFKNWMFLNIHLSIAMLGITHLRVSKGMGMLTDGDQSFSVYLSSDQANIAACMVG